MTDLLTEQQIIKSHRQVIHGPSGRYTRADEAIRVRMMAERMRERLEADTKAADLARGLVWEDGHYRAAPGAKLHTLECSPVEETVDPLPLFHAQKVAA